MSGHVIYVRFFDAFSQRFPFDRFLHLKDEDVDGAVESLRQEWWSDPVHRDRFESWQIEMERQQMETDILLRGTNYPLPTPPENLQSLTVMVSPATGERRHTPSFLKIAMCAGWRKWRSDEFPPHCISPRFPVARYDTKELADDAAAALRMRVSELASGSETTHNRGGQAVLFCSANPRFVVVDEQDLSRPELAVAREQILRLRGPVVGTPTVVERTLRTFWSLISPTLETIERLSVADMQPVVSEVELDDSKQCDGPFGADGFRFRGVEISFGRATLSRKLVLTLWDEENHCPRDARPVEDVLVEMYGDGHETSDGAFRQLCSTVRSRFQAANLAMTIEHIQGKVMLKPLPK